MPFFLIIMHAYNFKFNFIPDMKQYWTISREFKAIYISFYYWRYLEILIIDKIDQLTETYVSWIQIKFHLFYRYLGLDSLDDITLEIISNFFWKFIFALSYKLVSRILYLDKIQKTWETNER